MSVSIYWHICSFLCVTAAVGRRRVVPGRASTWKGPSPHQAGVEEGNWIPAESLSPTLRSMPTWSTWWNGTTMVHIEKWLLMSRNLSYPEIKPHRATHPTRHPPSTPPITITNPHWPRLSAAVEGWLSCPVMVLAFVAMGRWRDKMVRPSQCPLPELGTTRRRGVGRVWTIIIHKSLMSIQEQLSVQARLVRLLPQQRRPEMKLKGYANTRY